MVDDIPAGRRPGRGSIRRPRAAEPAVPGSRRRAVPRRRHAAQPVAAGGHDAEQHDEERIQRLEPAGRREETADLAAFYPKLGDALKKRYAGWTAYILSADMQLPKKIGLAASKRTPLRNGALECRLFEYKLVAGSNRR